MQEEGDYDLFISYAKVDENWVECVLIPALGVSNERIFTQSKFKLGTDKISEFERAIASSRYTLLILTPAFVNDKWTNFSEIVVSYSRVKQQRNCLIPLFLEPCQLPLHLDFLQELNCIDEADYDQEFARLRELLEQPEPKLEPIDCPYPGMKPFDQNNARFFYGREQEIGQLWLRLRKQNYFFIIGTSGAGKSSLIFAGLVPELEKKQPGQWLIKSLRPGQTASETPMQKLAKVLGGENRKASPTLEQYSQLVNSLLAQENPEAKILLIIDQFEELFSPSTTTEQTQLFITAIKRLRKVEKIRLILAMRADFYPDLMNSELWPLQEFERVEITPLQGERLREAIVTPAANCGVYVEAKLLERLLIDAAEEPGVLPLVQETMVLLWYRMERRLLALSAYEKLGEQASKVHPSGLAVAIATHADDTLQKLSEEQQKIARRIFIRLVQFGEGRADTRRQQTKQELQSVKDDSQQFEYTLEHLVKNRLLTPTSSKDSTDEETKIDIAHERLIASWPTFQKWLKYLRKAEEISRKLIAKVDNWEELNREGGLLDQVELKEANDWLESDDAKELGYSQNLLDLVEASRKAIDNALEESKKTNKKLRSRLRIAIISAILAILAAIGAGLGFWQATQQERIATSRQKAAQALYNIDKDYELALLLSVEAFGNVDTFEARNALLTTLQYAPQVMTFLHGHKAEILSLGFTEDEQKLVSGDRQGLVSLWNIWEQTSESDYVLGNEADIWAMTLSSDAQLLALGNSIADLQLWNTKEGQLIDIVWDGRDPPKINLPITILKFSPDNQRLAYGTRHTREGTERFGILDIGNQSSEVITLKLRSEVITYIHSKNEEKFGQITGGTVGGISATAFSSNGLTLAIAGNVSAMAYQSGYRSPLAFWNVIEKQYDSGYFAREHGWVITSLAFQPKNPVLASGSRVNDIRLWNLENEKKPVLSERLIGHTSSITDLIFSPDGKILVSGSQDKSIILWDLDEVIEADTGQPPEPPGFSIVGEEWDIWDYFDWEKSTYLPIESIRNNQLKLHKDSISSLAFPKNNSKILASASKDGTIIIWDISKSEFIGQPLTGYKKIDFNWRDLDKIGFSRDGNIIAFKTKEDAILMWNLKTNEPSYEFLIEDIVWESSLTNTAINQHSNLSATITPEGIVLKEKYTDKPLGQPLHNTSSFEHLVFSPDGKILVAVSYYGVMLFHVDLESWKANACRKANRQFTEIEQKDHFGTLLKNNPICMDISTDPIQARDFLISAEAQALESNIEFSIIQFKKALELDPSLDFNPEEKAKIIAAMGLIYQGEELVKKGEELVKKGEVEKAIAAYTDAQKLFPKLEISANSWNSLCWFGSVYEYADKVIDACEKSIEIEPNHGGYRDSRGLARGLTGDIQGAIEDFKFFVKWSEKNDVSESEREKRKIWISKLQSGEKPFDSETLRELR